MKESKQETLNEALTFRSSMQAVSEIYYKALASP